MHPPEPAIPSGPLAGKTVSGTPSARITIDGRTFINFFGSGMSCGGTIELTRLGAGYQVRVNWLTGGVEVVPHDRI